MYVSYIYVLINASESESESYSLTLVVVKKIKCNFKLTTMIFIRSWDKISYF